MGEHQPGELEGAKFPRIRTGAQERGVGGRGLERGAARGVEREQLYTIRGELSFSFTERRGERYSSAGLWGNNSAFLCLSFFIGKLRGIEPSP